MISKCLSPVHERQPFIWFADYGNGEMLTEFEDGGKENRFIDIDKSKTIDFGLMGCGVKLKFNAATGIFNIDGNKVEFVFRDSINSNLNITTANVEYTDFITYKSAYKDIDLLSGTSSVTIDGYFFGYKIKLTRSNGTVLYVKIVFALPINGGVVPSMQFGIKLSCKDATNGDFIVLENGNEYKKIPVVLEPNISKVIDCVYY